VSGRFGSLSFLMSFSADDAVEFERAASELVLQRRPWFYPRLVAIWLFLVIRQGIPRNG